MTDAWEDEGYAGEDDWGEESVAADVEEERVAPEADGEDEAELDETPLDLDG